MLKEWLVNDGKTDSILVEEKYTRWTEELRSDKYETVPYLNSCSMFFQLLFCLKHVENQNVWFPTQVTMLQLEQSYGDSADAKEFIQELIKGAVWISYHEWPCINRYTILFKAHFSKMFLSLGGYPVHAGQTGVPHPQAPNCKKAMMYKVLKEISEHVTKGQRGESAMTVGGRVRSPQMKALLAKQLGQGLQSLEGAGLVDLKTGRLQSKKAKKEKSQEQMAVDEVKKLQSKFLVLYISYLDRERYSCH